MALTFQRAVSVKETNLHWAKNWKTHPSRRACAIQEIAKTLGVAKSSICYIPEEKEHIGELHQKARKTVVTEEFFPYDKM